MPPERRLQCLLPPGVGLTPDRVPYSLVMSHTYVGIRKLGVVKQGNMDPTSSNLYHRFLPLLWCNVDLNWGKPVWAEEVPDIQEVAGEWQAMS